MINVNGHLCIVAPIVCLCVYGEWGFGHCFVVQYLVSFLVLQSLLWGRESWLFYFELPFNVM